MVAESSRRYRKKYSEDFLFYEYKVRLCDRRDSHDWVGCEAGHFGERAQRRNLRTYCYAPIACLYAKQGEACPRGEHCACAHNMFEYWLHPMRYRTELCQHGSLCRRAVCFFAHNLEELRPLHPALPPAELIWAAGALAVARNRQPRVPALKISSRSRAVYFRRRFEQDQWIAQQALMAFRHKQEQQPPYFQATTATAAASDTMASLDVADSRCEPFVPSTPLIVLPHSPAVPAPKSQQQQGMVPPASYWVLQNNPQQLLPSATETSLQYQLQPLEPPGLFVPAAASNTVSQLPVTGATQPQQQLVQFVNSGVSQMPTAALTGQPVTAGITNIKDMVVAATPAHVQPQLQAPTVLQRLVAAPVSSTPVDATYRSVAPVVQAPVNTIYVNSSMAQSAPFSIAANNSAVITTLSVWSWPTLQLSQHQ